MAQDLTKLITPDALEQLAKPAVYKYGTAIYKRGGTQVESSDAGQTHGWAGGLDGGVTEGGSARRRVSLTATGKGLQWTCTCHPKGREHIFCKHCVALALAVAKK
ncbi:MAG TPA: hypothetical protein VJM32_05455 [Candidatus Saccharimonadales bacterium]|nr:hypothetical protein [Candidatus Saccharimonadales bacterium]